jgi:hypothetical protein
MFVASPHGTMHRREFLRNGKGRTRPRRGVGHTGRGAHRALRVPRALLQWTAPPFRAWLSQPLSVRAATRTGRIGDLTQVSPKPDKVHSAFKRPTCILQKLLGAKRTAVVEAYEGMGSS